MPRHADAKDNAGLWWSSLVVVHRWHRHVGLADSIGQLHGLCQFTTIGLRSKAFRKNQLHSLARRTRLGQKKRTDQGALRDEQQRVRRFKTGLENRNSRAAHQPLPASGRRSWTLATTQQSRLNQQVSTRHQHPECVGRSCRFRFLRIHPVGSLERHARRFRVRADLQQACVGTGTEPRSERRLQSYYFLST